MIALNQIAEDFLNISQNDQALKILETKIKDAFDLTDSTTLELYTDSATLADFLLFHFFQNVKDFLEFYEINTSGIDYDSELNNDFEDDGDEIF